MKLWGLLVIALLCVGCGAAPRVPLSADWPQTAGDYREVTELWTRSASFNDAYQLVLHVDATLLSPQWRAARAQRDLDARGLSGAPREAALAEVRKQADGPWEIELLVTTWDRRENDLHRGDRATWRVALLDEQGNEVRPLEVVRDRRPAHVVRADFQHVGDFAQAYVARFAKEVAVLGPEARRVRLRVTSARGAVELVWQAP